VAEAIATPDLMRSVENPLFGAVVTVVSAA
jgi:hypothetical protein